MRHIEFLHAVDRSGASKPGLKNCARTRPRALNRERKLGAKHNMRLKIVRYSQTLTWKSVKLNYVY